MSEFLEVDYGAEEIQNEIKNQNKVEEMKDINAEQRDDKKNDKEIKQIKSTNVESDKKDPTFFIMRLDDQSICSSLISKQINIPVDLNKKFEKYFEVLIFLKKRFI